MTQTIATNTWRDHTCCICDDLIEGYGNNPWPIVDDDNSSACDRCNSGSVIPARLALQRFADMLTEARQYAPGLEVVALRPTVKMDGDLLDTVLRLAIRGVDERAAAS